MKKILFIIILLSMFWIFTVDAKEAIKTSEEAINWMKMQSDNKVYYDQCVDFTKAYVNWIMSSNMKATNVWPKNQTGNAIQIPANKLWEELEWEIINNTDNPDYIPEPGDIFVSKGSMPQYGHTGVVLESKSVSKAIVIDANYSNTKYPLTHEINWSKSYEAFYFIKPKFASKPVFNYSEVNGDYYIKNALNNKYLTVKDFIDEDRTNIYLDEFYSKNQVVKVSSGNYYNHKLIPIFSEKAINAWGDFPASLANVNLFKFVSKDPGTQVWKMEAVNNGYNIHLTYNENLCLSKDDVNVIIETCNGNLNQLWVLEEASSKVITNLDNLSVDNIERQAYTGKEIKPSVVVKDGDLILKEGIDYTLSYQNNINVGVAKVIINGRAYYDGKIEKEFRIYKEYTGPLMLGDLNNNKVIDMTDILLMLKAYYNNKTIEDYPNGDMNGDNMIELTDVLMLLRIFFNGIS